MEITETFYPRDRKAWRKWLQKNHAVKKEIWLIYPHKESGKPKINYIHAVQEALCFGWIDSTTLAYDDQSSVQRWTPRRPKSKWSEVNKHHARQMTAQGLMTPAGQALLPDLTIGKLTIAPDILKALKKDPEVWKNFRAFPLHYQHIRISKLEIRRGYPELFQKALAHLIKMTKRNKQFGHCVD